MMMLMSYIFFRLYIFFFIRLVTGHLKSESVNITYKHWLAKHLSLSYTHTHTHSEKQTREILYRNRVFFSLVFQNINLLHRIRYDEITIGDYHLDVGILPDFFFWWLIWLNAIANNIDRIVNISVYSTLFFYSLHFFPLFYFYHFFPDDCFIHCDTCPVDGQAVNILPNALNVYIYKLEIYGCHCDVEFLLLFFYFFIFWLLGVCLCVFHVYMCVFVERKTRKKYDLSSLKCHS